MNLTGAFGNTNVVSREKSAPITRCTLPGYTRRVNSA